MKTVLKIFRHDVHDIFTHLFVLITLLAVAVMPSLYAWINIYASWDPYSKTGNLKVAVASDDHGIVQNGKRIYSFDAIKKDLKKDDSMKWQFTKTADEAVKGVRSGEFYAAFVFEDGFTYDMHHFEKAIAAKKPAITYYRNEKKNAIAAKLTDLQADSMTDEINTEYLRNVFEGFFKDTGDLAGKINGENAVGRILKQLTQTKNALSDFDSSISMFSSASGDIRAALQAAGNDLSGARTEGKSDVAAAKKKFEESKQTIDTIKTELDKKAAAIEKAITDLKTSLDEKGLTDDQKKELAENAGRKVEKLLARMQTLRSVLPEKAKTPGAQLVLETLDHMISNAEKIDTDLQKVPLTSEIISNAKESVKVLDELYDDSLKPGISQMVTDIRTAVSNLRPLLSSTGKILDDIYPVLGAADDTVSGLGDSLTQLQSVLVKLEEKLGDIIREVRQTDKSEQKEKLIELLGGDSSRYSDYFSSMVGIRTEKVYSLGSYGEAMTPFYTVIALWVGGVMLVTIMQTNINRRRFPEATESQGFFGRLMIYVLIGQLQAAVVTAGNIFLMHCEPVHPWLMWLSAAVISLVFVTLIYALTLSFGDIGRAAVMILLFVQIAGSSGSFPIEILPKVFENIYSFFPFPYAVNSMREAICGLYGHDFVKYIGELMIFFVIAVITGVFIRRPFIGVKEFVTEKQKETGVM